MQKNKIMAILIGGVLLGTIAIFIVSQSRSDVGRYRKKAFEQSLRVAIERKAQSESDRTVELRDLTDFEWEKVYIFPPYTSADQIKRDLGFDWPSAKDTGIEMFDQYNLLVFVQRGTVIHYVMFPHKFGDFVTDGLKNGLGLPEAKFKVEVKDGRPLLLSNLPFNHNR
jgi:hypothetical protein